MRERSGRACPEATGGPASLALAPDVRRADCLPDAAACHVVLHGYGSINLSIPWRVSDLRLDRILIPGIARLYPGDTVVFVRSIRVSTITWHSGRTSLSVFLQVLKGDVTV